MSMENLTVAQLVKTFPVSYGTRRFIIVFTRARWWSAVLSQMNLIHILTPNFFQIILILSFHVRHDLPNGLFTSYLPVKMLYECPVDPILAKLPGLPVLPHLTAVTMFYRQKNAMHLISTGMQLPQVPHTSPVLGQTLSSLPCHQTHS
jgi:hypothetical protein